MIIDHSYQTKNFNQRPLNTKIDYIIIHNTERDFTISLNLLTQPSDYPVSCHYLLDENGIVYQLLDDDLRAWHAGQSYWQGYENLNNNSIGIELVNTQPDPFKPDQIIGCIELCHYLMQTHNIAPTHILAHSDIAPYRKGDPGDQFPWNELAQQGIVPSMLDISLPYNQHQNLDPIKLLAQIGYDIRPLRLHPQLLSMLVTNFQRRHCQDHVTGILDEHTIKCINVLSSNVIML